MHTHKEDKTNDLEYARKKWVKFNQKFLFETLTV